MTPHDLLDRLSRMGRGPLLAALVALIAGLPGIFTLPPMDRDESRFAEASAQMLESGDFTSIMFQDQPRFKKPVGVYWLQALSARAFSSAGARQIWAYRLPSLLGAMLAAAACAWGAMAWLRPGLAVLAGAMLGSSFMLSTEAFTGKTDALLCGFTTLAMAALARLYLAARGGPPAGMRTKLLLWLGLAGATLDKGPVGPMVAALTILALLIWERKLDWVRTLGWSWGPILFVGIVGPWAWAITVATDGAFWGAAIGGDLGSKLAGGSEGHGAPPGFHTLLTPLLLFPACLLLPAGVMAAWRGRAEPAIRFALCWLIPSWLVFEATPTKLIHYTLPLYGALAWLMAGALREPLGRIVRWSGAGLTLLAGAAFAGLAGYAAWRFGEGALTWAWAVIAALAMLAAATVGGYLLLGRRAARAAVVCCALGVIGHGALAGGLAPRLKPLWLSQQVAEIIGKARMSPLQGLAQGPVTVAGYAEPSLVFALGTHTVLAGPQEAADAIADGRPAVVEARQEQAFQAALVDDEVAARLVGQVAGLDYSNGKQETLRVYAPVPDDAGP